MPPQLDQDIAHLRASGQPVEVVEDGARFYLILPGYVLPQGRYAMASADLMVMADYQYPLSRMDMFWTIPEVRCPNGSLPQSADQFEDYAGRRWQRWSWHYPVWDPAKHNLLTHLEVVRDRLCRGC